MWLGPHDRIMRLWIHGGCTMNPQPHDPIMRLWIHGTQGIGPGTRHWPRTASPHGRTMRLWIHGGCTMNPQPHDPIMRGDGPASPQYCTVLYCTGSWIKDQGSRIKDLGPCSGMNDHPGRDTDVISRPSKSTIKDLSFYIGFTRIGSSYKDRIKDLGSWTLFWHE